VKAGRFVLPGNRCFAGFASNPGITSRKTGSPNGMAKHSMLSIEMFRTFLIDVAEVSGLPQQPEPPGHSERAKGSSSASRIKSTVISVGLTARE